MHLLFNNAGIGGGGSFLKADRAEWDRTFAIDWGGVYCCARAFVPLLVASDEGHLVNTSSVNGFWAILGHGVPHTAYSSAKFAVKGFSEALLEHFLQSSDQPSIDGFNTFCVSKLAHDYGLKVVLSGLGGDEIFGGYKSFVPVPRMVGTSRWLTPVAVLRAEGGELGSGGYGWLAMKKTNHSAAFRRLMLRARCGPGA